MGSQVKFFKCNMFLSQKFVFNSANSVDTDEMRRYAPFHLGLHCLAKHLFTGVQSEKG